MCSCSPRLRRSPASGAARHICMPLRSMCTQAQCCVSHCHTIPTRVLPFSRSSRQPRPGDPGSARRRLHLPCSSPSTLRHPPVLPLTCSSGVDRTKPNGRFGPDRLWTVMRITVATISRANRSSQQPRPRGGDKRRSWADSSSLWCLWKVVIQLSEDHAGNTIKLT